MSHKPVFLSRSEMKYQPARGFPPHSREMHSCKKISLVLCAVKLMIAQLLQGQVIVQNAIGFQYFGCVLTPHLFNTRFLSH